MTQPLGGMYAALMTGLADDGGFDPDRQRALDAHVMRQGLTGLYVGGSSGESGLLETDELLAQQEIVAEDAAATATRLIAHVGSPATANAIRLATSAERLGYHALSALPPHAYPFSDAEIVAYYRDLAGATDLPLIVYEVPARTGRPIPLPVLDTILGLQGVGGIKFTSTDLFKMSVLRRHHPEALFFFGFDEIYLSGVVLGADGGIGTTYNLLGRLYMELDRAVRASDLNQAQKLHAISARFVEDLTEVGVLPGMKAALRAVGIETGPTRAPLAPQRADTDERMRALVSEPEIGEWV